MKPSSAVILLLSFLGPSVVLGVPQNYYAAPTSTLDSVASSTAAGSTAIYTLPDQSPGAVPTPPPEVYYPSNGNVSHPSHHGNGTHPHHHHQNGTYADYEHHNGTYAHHVNGTEFEYTHHNGTNGHHKNGTELEHHHHLHNGSKPMNFTGAGEDPSGADVYPTPY
ncbi:MAG: hypothetical protein M1824_003326 [Vezdaea acicularis]|nr:MAG: hypothetical protein M1824_003326 [Vezdaea acicularis]